MDARVRAELERALPQLRTRLLAEMAAGRADAAEVLPRLSILGIELPDPAGVTFARLGPGQPLPAPGKLVEAEFGLATIVEEVLAPFAPVHGFEDEADGYVVLSSAPGGETWADVPAEISARAERRLGLPVIVTQRTIRGGAPVLVGSLRETIEELRDEAGPGGDRFVERARGYIERSYMRQDLSLEETAEAIAVSPDHLSRLMRRETGRSFVEYLSMYRITRAMALLAQPRVKMLEVAELTGFSSQHYFSRVFRRVSGLSPTEYRREAAP